MVVVMVVVVMVVVVVVVMVVMVVVVMVIMIWQEPGACTCDRRLEVGGRGDCVCRCVRRRVLPSGTCPGLSSDTL